MIKESRILITGGAGFIGSNLCDHMLGLGASVTCLDNFSTGHRENITHLANNPKFTLIEGDIRNQETCTLACRNHDYVLHQAALGSVPRSIEDPLVSNSVNIDGFLSMLIAAKEAKVKRFIYAASSSAYGDSPTLPKVEKNTGVPLSPYAVTKYTNELYAKTFSSVYGMETVGLRYFNVFGRRQDPNGAYAAVIPKFIKALINGQSPLIHGDGSFSRDFTYVDNVLLMNELALESPRSCTDSPVYNTACGERTTLLELVDILRDQLSAFDPSIHSLQATFGAPRPGDIPHSFADINLAKSDLNYTPQFDVRAGLKEAIAWYWANLQGTNAN